MIKLINPTNQNITVSIFGNEYYLEAEGSISVDERVAEYWIGNLHKFLRAEEESVAKTEVSDVEVEVKKTKSSKK